MDLDKVSDEEIIVYDANLNKVKITSEEKLVIINIFAIWCQYCKEELPYFDEIIKKQKDVKVYMVCSVSSKDEILKVNKFIKDNNYQFEVYFDMESKLYERYNVIGFPTTIFLDSCLNTVAKNVGLINKKTLIENIEKYK